MKQSDLSNAQQDPSCPKSDFLRIDGVIPISHIDWESGMTAEEIVASHQTQKKPTHTKDPKVQITTFDPSETWDNTPKADPKPDFEERSTNSEPKEPAMRYRDIERAVIQKARTVVAAALSGSQKIPFEDISAFHRVTADFHETVVDEGMVSLEDLFPDGLTLDLVEKLQQSFPGIPDHIVNMLLEIALA
ncbi:hypothetical protein CO051_02470 [Candidatus Roizmanbacteria bacterium CG_4_9_14_0_2_um_filter_39_13]|uniref:Uncharacterized protein n=2 Tax=Candidatus Roizmaniibacteriota TaxID=1752723 RepID=A0A2M8F0K7_9BACT|nr:MAG: hypothetical protein COY15_03605 [Candidatus Roizmanbacteria bacterium CG_4_10_14_0_2_um_filter_39_12]PJC32818.1 MAG: hypothetical protein CO051_02470 [Candidatus Roizmanbacteria bacterium CG_4_9_14_0_2_um_filter_39_13]PJE61449.1 MAG: hypothetical protein COU87_04585 [Candidatus Roizmanbacteria bacterium CG10_big_fil_rev_8_21_14_0_10_39_12]